MSKKNKFSVRDLFVILFCLLAAVGLALIVKDSREKQREEALRLQEISGNYEREADKIAVAEEIGNIVFNEVNPAGWVEFHNNSTKAKIPLENCVIKVNGVEKYRFADDAVMEVYGFLLAEGLGKLTESDIVTFCQEEIAYEKSIKVPEIPAGLSYGATDDGGMSFAMMSDTKGFSNRAATVPTTSELTFSIPGGFYDDSFFLEMAAGPGERIYYTLDGSEPTAESEPYTGRIEIYNRSGNGAVIALEGRSTGFASVGGLTMGTVVKAIAIDEAGRKSDVVTESYYVGITRAGDVADIPVFSLSTDADNLFDYFEGIYVPGRTYEEALVRGEDTKGVANYYNGWEKPVHVEFFSVNKDKTFEEDMTISIYVDEVVENAQKSLFLKGKASAGQGTGLEDYYVKSVGGIKLLTHGMDNNYMLRDYLVEQLMAETKMRTRKLQPCAVFINGEYWGVYAMEVPYDETYIAGTYHVNEKDVLLAVNGEMEDEEQEQELLDLVTFIAMEDMTLPENYEQVKSRMDVDSYLEYFCTNMYLANVNFGKDTLTMWKTARVDGTEYGDGRWRFLLPSMAASMDNGMAGALTTASINSYLQKMVTVDPLFQSLVVNDEFRSQLKVTMEYLVTNVFTEEKVEAALQLLSASRKKPALANYRRFKGNVNDSLHTAEVNKLRLFFGERDEYMLRYTEEVVNQSISWTVGE